MDYTIRNMSVYDGSYRRVGLPVIISQGQLYVDSSFALNMTYRWYSNNLLVWVHALRRITQRWGPGVPDVQLLLAADDDPTQDITNNNTWTGGYWPVFRHCRSTQSADITVPTWHFYEMNATARYFSQTDRYARDYPWETKEHRAFGAGISYHRSMNLEANKRVFEHKPSEGIPAIEIRRVFQDYLRTQLRHPNITYEDFSPITDWGRYKMVMHVDGITCSSRIWQLLSLGSVVLREESNYLGFYDGLLKSYVHYVPFWSRRPREVLWAYEWVGANEEAARRIAGRGQAWARDHLAAEGLECYWLQLLAAYARLLRFEPGSGRPRHGPGGMDPGAGGDGGGVAGGAGGEGALQAGYMRVDEWLERESAPGYFPDRWRAGYVRDLSDRLELLPPHALWQHGG